LELIGIIIIVICALVLLILLGYFVSIYNALVRLKKNIDKAWSNIDVLLKQRVDELGKLMKTVGEFMKFEKNVLTEVTEARTGFLSANSVSEKARADSVITSALKSLFAVAENYPDLKSNQSFLQFQSRISELENQIADRREFYNDSVNTYNIRIAQIPHVIVARMLHYDERELYQVADSDRQDVAIEFN